MCPIGKPKFFYGYWILIASFAALFFNVGAGFYTFGVFFKPIQEEFNWSREVTSVAFTMLFIIQAIASPFIGRFVERYGPKKVITLGAIITGFGLFQLSLTTSLPYFYAAYAVTGLGITAMGMIPLGLVISNWFVKKRGTALGISSTGIGAAGIVLPPIVGAFLIPTFGWRTAYQILALLSVLIVAIATQLVIKTSPREMGLYSDGIEPSEVVEEKKSSSNPSDVWRIATALKTSTFWFIVGALVLYNLAFCGTIQNLVNHLTDIGFPIETATLTVSFIGLGSTIGKFSLGHLSDRISVKYCATISFSLVLVATLILIILNPASPTVLIWVYAFIMGLGLGGDVPLPPLLLSQNFGLTNYGTIYGIMSLFITIGTGVGPIFFGYVYDATQTYYWAFIASLAMYLAAIALILALRRPSYARSLMISRR